MSIQQLYADLFTRGRVRPVRGPTLLQFEMLSATGSGQIIAAPSITGTRLLAIGLQTMNANGTYRYFHTDATAPNALTYQHNAQVGVQHSFCLLAPVDTPIFATVQTSNLEGYGLLWYIK